MFADRLNDPRVQKLVSDPMGRPAPNVPLVDDWDCLRGMVGAVEGSCGKLGEWGMRHTRFFANLCNSGVRVEQVSVAAAATCATAVSR
jgi:legumain